MGSGRPAKHGRYATQTAQAINAKIERYKEDPQPGTLWDELAVQRALLQEYLERLTAAPTIEQTDHILAITESIGRMVDRISKIMSRTALTVAELQVLQAGVADVLMTYVPAEQRAEAIKALRQRLGMVRRITYEDEEEGE